MGEVQSFAMEEMVNDESAIVGDIFMTPKVWHNKVLIDAVKVFW